MRRDDYYIQRDKPPCTDKRKTTLKAIYSKSAVWTCLR